MLHKLKYLAHRNIHRERYSLLDGLLATQSLGKDAVRLKQAHDLAGMISFAAMNTPFYREKYHNHTLPAVGEAIGNLPILRKSEVVARKDDMLATTIDRRTLRIGNTGGSTGKPLAFYYDPHKMELMRAGMYRSYMMSGWRPGQKILNFWGARQDIKADGIAKRLTDFIAADKTIGAYEYTESDLAAWADYIRHYRPVLLQGYASILAELARYILDHGKPVPGSLLGVYSTAEMLHDWQRDLMEIAFNCKVFNQYGSREIPNIACECLHGNQHVFTDMVYLESVREDDEDKLIVTSLTNRIMPMIRYDIGDVGRLMDGDCPCGSPFPLVEMGVCRSNDLIKSASGKTVYPSYFIHLLDGLDGIKQYQFVQTALNEMTLNLQASRMLTLAEQEHIQSKIRDEVDADMHLDIRHVDTIKRTRSGKHRFVIRDIA